MPGGVSSINKIKGPSLMAMRRQSHRIRKAKYTVEPTVLHGKQGYGKKKQKQMERAIRNEQRFLVNAGLIEQAEEEMKGETLRWTGDRLGTNRYSFLYVTDVEQINPKKQRVQVIVPDEVLAAAAAGPGTTLGNPL
ncbi:hypothetical protein DM01DRAFT_1386318 [Hesseltinella vesiculosa]|uniref:Uncharacterized protein n=1 Tax=Hesseltinella vesiculosa TaxID=101127 RepID=A0A1X2G624_9FUNG|nr:hypothetical protein DM01DRAFT_1386318 [Hesseltinella vesiculosa]